MNIKHIIIYTLSLLMCACEKIVLGEEIENTAPNNFDLFWKDIDEHYSLFEVREFNWDSIYHTYKPQVKETTTDEELWEVFKSMMAYLDDSHCFILNPKVDFDQDKDTDYFESGSLENNLAKETFSIELLQDKYLENITEIKNSVPNIIQAYAKIKNKNIGYIYLNGMEADDYNFMDTILAKIKIYQAIILDLRNNTGGSDLLAAKIAGRFATNEELIYTVEEKNGPSHNDFSSKISYYSKKTGKEHYNKPLIVLTDKITVSAAEIMLLHLKSFDQVTQIGDITAGDFSDTSMRRFLPNGWQYQYSIFKFLLPNGRSLDGIGHIPDISIKNTLENIEDSEDKVLEKAIEYLLEEYAIE